MGIAIFGVMTAHLFRPLHQFFSTIVDETSDGNADLLTPRMTFLDVDLAAGFILV